MFWYDYNFVFRSGSTSPDSENAATPVQQPTVILQDQGEAQGDLIGDLLNMDLGPPMMGSTMPVSQPEHTAAIDLLGGGGMDSLVRNLLISVKHVELYSCTKRDLSLKLCLTKIMLA